MGRIVGTFFVLVIGAMAASADEMPARKAGLWEITTGMGDHSIKMRQCIDATTDHALQAHIGAAPQGNCSKLDKQKSGSTITIDSVCTIAGKTMTSHIVITGSFDSEYTLTMTSQGEGKPAGPAATLNAKWLGPCAADQKPGDIILANGLKINILTMQKGGGRPGAAGAPPAH
jgi:Protein of unknown function (DUF3617)